MNKSLNKNDTLTTPFISTKDWRLSNVANEDLLLMENDNTVALEFGDYHPLFSFSNATCSIAKENQEIDKARYRQGLKNSGIFYPDQEPANADGTFKRVVYSQIRTMFYNQFRDPTKIWGIEKIDFESSKTKRFLVDRFKLFDVPTIVFGEKILENSVLIHDTSTDNDYIIQDDGDGNLFAFSNLFYRQQEIGVFNNVFLTGSLSGCHTYLNFSCPNDPTNLSASQASATSSFIHLTWNDNSDNELGFVIERSQDGGEFLPIIYTGPNITSSEDTSSGFNTFYAYRLYAYNAYCNSDYTNTSETISSSFVATDTLMISLGGTAIISGGIDTGFHSGSVDTKVFIVSGSDSSSVSVKFQVGSMDAAPPTAESFGPIDMGFFDGSVINTVLVTSGSDSGSVGSLADSTISFLSGIVQDTVLIISGSDSGSVGSLADSTISFLSGSIQDTVLITSGSDTGSIFMGLSSGSLQIFTIVISGSDSGSIRTGFLSGLVSP